MAEDSKSFEKALDRDFLYYLTLIKSLFENFKEDEERRMCKVWLNYLFGKTSTSVAEKCDRNVYLSRLILQMQNGKLKGMFLDSPPSGPLPSSFTAFGLPTEIDGLKGFEDKGFQIDSSVGVGSGDFFESSRDGRTYIATRHLPQGTMAFLAVTNNEGDPVWVPQPCPSTGTSIGDRKPPAKKPEGFIKKLSDFVDAPLAQCRKPSEERDQIIEWVDKIINDCTKWLQGEDPHNMDLEQLFELMYEDYQKDPDKSEILKHPRIVRNTIFKDIRDIISERRGELTQRELVLDQYESDQYEEVDISEECLDDVWLECAKKPLNEKIKLNLEKKYPIEVINRFFELLYQERLMIIRKGEAQARKKIEELRKVSEADIKKELQNLKKVQDEYKGYYVIYKEVEQKMEEFQEYDCKNKATTANRIQDPAQIEKLKQEIEVEVQRAKESFDKERRVQHELQEKLEEAREAYRKVKHRMAVEEEKLNCEMNQISIEKCELEDQISNLKKRKQELKNSLNPCRR